MKKSWLWIFVVSLELSQAGLSAAVKTQARLVLSAQAAKPGDDLWAGVYLKMPPGWHTYWRNAGDSGAPTTIDWNLPEGVTAGEIQWPVPEKFTDAGLTTYVYHNEVVLLVALKLASNVAVGPLELTAKVSWLECEKLCVPGKAAVKAALTIGSTAQPSPEAAFIESWQKKVPQADSTLAAQAWWESSPADESRAAIIEAAINGNFTAADFFPYASDAYEILPETRLVSNEGDQVRLQKTIKKKGDNWPSQVQGVLVHQTSSAKEWIGREVTLTFAAAPLPASAGTAAAAAAPQVTVPQRNLLAMLLFAFIGGLILNIMPCVLPVIALKVLGFVQQSKESPAQVRKLGLVYGLGVLVSFLALALVVIGVQQAGRAASWGMQFQNPKFLIAMTVLVTLVALNLFGVFEVILGGGAMSAATELASKEGNAGAFFNGVLATALATPCTAPFLGVALGFAFAQSPAIIALMFLTIGLGLALPYVLLSFAPGLLKFLPKPGAWMEHFKIAMGFPMLATAVWLFTLTTPHFGRGSVLWLGIFLVMLAAAAWVWGTFVQRGRKRRGFAMAVSFLLLAIGYFYALEGQLHWRLPSKAKAGGSPIANHPDEIQWQPWSADAVKKAQAEGRPIFVDFTAEWCFTCQANKKTSIEIASVRAKLKEINAVPLLGDYTTEDDAITAELQKFGRAGVPLVLVYSADTNKPAIVLPEVLTPRIVLEALDKAAGHAARASQ